MFSPPSQKQKPSDGVILLDYKKRITNINNAALTILGVSLKDAKGRNITDLLPAHLRCATSNTKENNKNLDTTASKKHYISIEIKDTGEGSVFSVILPVTQQETRIVQ